MVGGVAAQQCWNWNPKMCGDPMGWEQVVKEFTWGRTEETELY